MHWTTALRTAKARDLCPSEALPVLAAESGDATSGHLDLRALTEIDSLTALRALARLSDEGTPPGPADLRPGSREDRAVGCLLAGAVGDALGGAVEFLSLPEIHRQYGPAGITDFDVAYGRRGAITDDTQMTLFTAEALATAAPPDRLPALRAAYLRWLRTQEERSPSGSGLLAVPELHSRRAPGNTCLSALVATRDGVLGTVTAPINDSKGCGGVMRAAPAGLVAADEREAFDLGCALAALTHGHPSGYLPAGVLAAAVHLLLRGVRLDLALDAAVALAGRHPRHAETTDALAAARRLAAAGRPSPRDLESLGGGWTGEEALAIAVCAALTADDLPDGLVLAVNHSGDSDSTGSLCGNLLGTLHGAHALPPRWYAELELGQLVVTTGLALLDRGR